MIGLTDMDGQDNYRQRLYQTYTCMRQCTGADAARLAIESRRLPLEHLIRAHFPADRDAVVWELGSQNLLMVAVK